MSSLIIKSKNSMMMGANCYMVSDGENYIIIDPAVNYEIMKKMAVGNLVGVLITHGHFDHIDELASYLHLSNIKIYAHKNCMEKLISPVKNCSKLMGNDLKFTLDERFVTIKDGDILDILKTNIAVLETKGHTNCSVTYIIADNMFTGDFLFKGAIGRTDLYSGDNGVMEKSLKMIKNILENYVVYPGHGPNTTLNDEKRNNMYLL